MKRLIESITASALARVNRIPERMTDPESIRQLIDKLAPVITNQKLIRLGPVGDGGYLVPDDLEGIEACFSPGVSFVSGFETDCAERNMKVFLADRSVDGPAEENDLFSFTKHFIGAFPDEGFLTLDGWVADSVASKDSDLMLQIDIEGFEYEVFLAATEKLMKRFRVIVVEFHELDKLFRQSFFRFASRAIEKILSTHTCVHIHPNNVFPPVEHHGIVIPPLLEMTFVRNDRVPAKPTFTDDFPHSLDSPCTNNPELTLPACWHGKSK
jgi:hypothetical protein